MTARAMIVAALLLGSPWLAGVSAIARADEQPSTTPGQPGGDPAPDTQTALDLISRGRYEDGITAAKRSLGRDERYVPAMLAMAKAYYYLHKYELSTSIVEIAKGIEPNNALAYELLGYISLAHDDRISATAAFKKAVELKDDYGNGWNNLAAMYLYAKNYDAAVEATEKATKLLPRFDKAWLNLGSAYRGKQRYDESERAYRKALEINSGYAEVYFDLGILYLDAPQMPGIDITAKLNQSIAYLSRYKDFASRQAPVANDPTDAYIEEAKKALVLEGKRLEREKKKKERQQPKSPEATPGQTPPPASPPPAAPAPTPTPTPAPTPAPTPTGEGNAGFQN